MTSNSVIFSDYFTDSLPSLQVLIDDKENMIGAFSLKKCIDECKVRAFIKCAYDNIKDLSMGIGCRIDIVLISKFLKLLFDMRANCTLYCILSREAIFYITTAITEYSKRDKSFKYDEISYPDFSHDCHSPVKSCSSSDSDLYEYGECNANPIASCKPEPICKPCDEVAYYCTSSDNDNDDDIKIYKISDNICAKCNIFTLFVEKMKNSYAKNILLCHKILETSYNFLSEIYLITDTVYKSTIKFYENTCNCTIEHNQIECYNSEIITYLDKMQYLISCSFMNDGNNCEKMVKLIAFLSSGYTITFGTFKKIDVNPPSKNIMIGNMCHLLSNIASLDNIKSSLNLNRLVFIKVLPEIRDIKQCIHMWMILLHPHIVGTCNKKMN